MEYHSIIAGLLLSLFPLNSAAADVVNERNLFSEKSPCRAYSEFLEGNPSEEENGCHPISNFLISEANSSHLEFLQKYDEALADDTGLDFLVQAQTFIIRNEPVSAYFWLDISDRQHFSDMIVAGDVERAVFYAALISKAKADAVKSLCNANYMECERLAGYIEVDEVFSDLSPQHYSTKSDILLLCLLRSDAYVLPLKEVLKSARFNQCIVQ
ncbi:hypothetical protein [Ruegeria atlantica]|uniref:hypothetical protein n=1 Tax=Ruegeria atlantica TaxID=81569 RepID=UPI00147CAE45|nr:hypothetical protein [Ruegeria atlantica]